MKQTSLNPKIHFIPLPGKTHFTGLGPTNKLIAAKIIADEGTASHIVFTDAEVEGGSAPK